MIRFFTPTEVELVGAQNDIVWVRKGIAMPFGGEFRRDLLHKCGANLNDGELSFLDIPERPFQGSELKR